jgi:peptidoglycan-associated lipoprotein
MVTRGAQFLVATLVIGTALFAGCAKRPATTAASAPAPTGTVATAPPVAPVVAPPPAPAPAPPAMAPPATAAPAPPAAPTARPEPKEFAAVPELKPIYFDFDKYDIRPADAKVLDANAQWLKSNDSQLLLIEGHCDERGTNEYNLALGERRAKSTMNYLVSQGVQASRITIISYGEERPVCTQKNEECWSKNRRAQFLVKPR